MVSGRGLESREAALLLVDDGLPTRICEATLADAAPGSHAYKSLRLLAHGDDQAWIPAAKVFAVQRSSSAFLRMRRMASRLGVRVAVHPYSSALSTDWLRAYACQYFSHGCLHITSMGHMGSGIYRLPGGLPNTLAVGVATPGGHRDVRCGTSSNRPDVWIRPAHFLREGDKELYGGTSAAVCVAGAYACHVEAELRRNGMIPSALQLRLIMMVLAQSERHGEIRLLEPAPLPQEFSRRLLLAETFADELQILLLPASRAPLRLAVSCLREPTSKGVVMGEVPYEACAGNGAPFSAIGDSLRTISQPIDDQLSVRIRAAGRCHISVVALSDGDELHA